MIKRNYAKDLLFGVAIGDAMGLPIEFEAREYLESSPITEMTGFGTWDQPPGTFSDDSSLTFCLAEALINGFNLINIGQNFVNWYKNGYWAAHNEVFDIGFTTETSIKNIIKGVNPENAGQTDIKSNGNGSLMRISPLILYSFPLNIEERFELCRKVSSITHGHPISIISCFYFTEFLRLLILGKEKFEIYEQLKSEIKQFFTDKLDYSIYLEVFKRLLVDDIQKINVTEIESSTYVLHTLEASIWSILRSNSYEQSIITAINLGEDTDTTGAVTGALAGLIYGFSNIPETWLRNLVKSDDISLLSDKLNTSLFAK